MPRNSGRPRGSGKVHTIPALELTQSEAVPFAIGHRISAEAEVGSDFPIPDLPWFYARMTSAERRYLVTADRRKADMWIMIGTMQRWLEDSVNAARSA